jgi:hypothetical protein
MRRHRRPSNGRAEFLVFGFQIILIRLFKQSLHPEDVHGRSKFSVRRNAYNDAML